MCGEPIERFMHGEELIGAAISMRSALAPCVALSLRRARSIKIRRIASAAMLKKWPRFSMR